MKLINWFKENTNRHLSYRVIRQQLFTPIDLLVSWKGRLLAIVLLLVGIYIGNKWHQPLSDYEVASTACDSRELIVRHEIVLLILEDVYVSKLVFICPKTNDNNNQN